MALNIILVCLVAVAILNVLLIYDLYGRSARIAEMATHIHQHHLRIAAYLPKAADNPTE